ncbi:MAG: hypothetical protein V1659_01845 [Candidatus Woesearchaeota archaeon]
MVHELVYSPNWFFGKDIIIDIVAVIVLLLIGFVSIKNYSLLGKTNKKHLFFGISFVLIAISIIAKITTNFTLYYHKYEIVQQIKNVIIVQQTSQASMFLFLLGFLVYHMFMLWGLYGVFATISNESKKSNIALAVFLIAVLTYFTNQLYYIFHLVSFFLIVLIIIRYQQNYLNNRNSSTKYLLIGFILLAISQVAFIFEKLSSIIYVAAEIIQLIGFLMLLITLLLVFKHGKKKKPYRHNK